MDQTALKNKTSRCRFANQTLANGCLTLHSIESGETGRVHSCGYEANVGTIELRETFVTDVAANAAGAGKSVLAYVRVSIIPAALTLFIDCV